MCGRHTDLISLRLSKTWCMTSYRVFEKLQESLPAGSPSGHGVRMRVANFFFDKPIEQNEEEYQKMCEIEAAKVSLNSHVHGSPRLIVGAASDPRL